MKIVTIIGARPQFIKAAMISRAIKAYNRIEKKRTVREYILHTGQHYDKNMNDVFLDELGIEKPDRQLHCGGFASHAKMLAEMLTGIEKALLEYRPDGVLVYGDTTSTLAGALAASQLHIPVMHVEAGLRSFNRQMPEEMNRILTDHVASLLFCPTYQAIGNLAKEGVTKGIFYTGDVMYDAALAFGEMAEKKSKILSSLGIQPKKFRLCTIHRAENTDNPERLTQIILALLEIATPDCPVIFPLHPRTKVYIGNYNLDATIASNSALRMIEPVSYPDMIMLEKNAETVFTDSGGVQKEAYFHRTPCITLRDETEWVETVHAGWNRIAGFNTEKIVECLAGNPERSEIKEYGDGHAAEKIINAIMKSFEAGLC
ncbi:MAG: UDP-N-acetylglucosamine 2-epimerase (non-hydrolyzing) [Tannerella sp.]|jgi:UDP-GlcNAc3NAcA epimerase|nr:UDP-N-acetylglucosamine 2-epimerase (non-hydrolyzing) [Tannerella sp.]